MPRPWQLPVEPFSERTPSRWYRCRVIGVDKNTAPAGLLVTLEDIDGEQRGRRTSIVLDLPIRPAGLTHDFFIACGQEVAVGKTVSPKLATGAIVNVRFAALPGDEEPQPVAFEPPPTKELIDDQ